MFDDVFDGYYSDSVGLTGAALHEMLLSSVRLCSGWGVLRGEYNKSVFMLGSGCYRVVVGVYNNNSYTDQLILCVLLFRSAGNIFRNIDYTKCRGDVFGNCSPLFSMSDYDSVESAVYYICDILHRIMPVVDSGAYDEV